MKSGVSTLNPYAASYIPLAKRVADDKSEVQKVTVKDSSNAMGTERLLVPVNSQPICDSYGSSSQHSNEQTDKQMLDDEFDMDLEYIQMQFPDVSVQSITDVYMTNKGDLEATIDMLDQLESHTFDCAESLPETLDIGDISVSGPATESATLKLKEVVGGASSSSGTLDVALNS